MKKTAFEKTVDAVLLAVLLPAAILVEAVKTLKLAITEDDCHSLIFSQRIFLIHRR